MVDCVIIGAVNSEIGAIDLGIRVIDCADHDQLRNGCTPHKTHKSSLNGPKTLGRGLCLECQYRASLSQEVSKMRQSKNVRDKVKLQEIKSRGVQ